MTSAAAHVSREGRDSGRPTAAAAVTQTYRPLYLSSVEHLPGEGGGVVFARAVDGDVRSAWLGTAGWHLWRTNISTSSQVAVMSFALNGACPRRRSMKALASLPLTKRHDALVIAIRLQRQQITSDRDRIAATARLR